MRGRPGIWACVCVCVDTVDAVVCMCVDTVDAVSEVLFRKWLHSCDKAFGVTGAVKPDSTEPVPGVCIGLWCSRHGAGARGAQPGRRFLGRWSLVVSRDRRKMSTFDARTVSCPAEPATVFLLLLPLPE